jgi:hypothetical protein
MKTPGTAPLLIADCLRPGQAMIPLPLNLAAEVVAELQTVTDQMGTSRTSLGRHFLLQGLEQITQGPHHLSDGYGLGPELISRTAIE